ncbi:recombinase family protein [Nonomuraea sp. NEAU-A123]|uniref:recombinase family protein n=1 Tax=Nonomuraea sp. NEAU-A123 TaxID=2839649 RepID=UPI001BE433FF|nr:recombinase family protein [Nonomuraea sp. NEAU-A123]MBT2234408.1 recombinase family protein [Nonomuraea sp. NEAU-A123]
MIEPRRRGLRFVFYGRVSTEDHQDPVSSRARQRDQAAVLVARFGRIVAEYFDVGQSRVLPWSRRPEAAALVVAMADPERGFDAIVVGEYERGFYGSQFALMAPLFEHYGVQLWMPEVGGRVDFAGEGHEQLMIALGIQSKREITRARIRVRTAMAAQVREQGRYQGGRPPYGYRLVDAGPHPNRAHAAWGRRAWRLEPDPDTAPIVTWMFAQRRAGHSLARITRALNDADVPCPSAADPKRNAHRSGAGWTLTTVRAILCNPRYTGRQVWNRQPSEHELIDPGNTGLGHRQVQRWNLPDGWVISTRPAHPALVSEADFIALQGMRAVADGTRSERCYLLAGLLRCGICGRRLESCWANNRAAYRCRHGHSSASRPDPDRPKNLYIRQDRILPHLPALYVLLAGPDLAGWPTSALPLGVADIIGRLRADRMTLVYDPETRALRADTREEVKVILDPAR